MAHVSASALIRAFGPGKNHLLKNVLKKTHIRYMSSAPDQKVIESNSSYYVEVQCPLLPRGLPYNSGTYIYYSVSFGYLHYVLVNDKWYHVKTSKETIEIIRHIINQPIICLSEKEYNTLRKVRKFLSKTHARRLELFELQQKERELARRTKLNRFRALKNKNNEK